MHARAPAMDQRRTVADHPAPPADERLHRGRDRRHRLERPEAAAGAMGVYKVLVNSLPPVVCAPWRSRPSGYARGDDDDGNAIANAHNMSTGRAQYSIYGNLGSYFFYRDYTCPPRSSRMDRRHGQTATTNPGLLRH